MRVRVRVGGVDMDAEGDAGGEDGSGARLGGQPKGQGWEGTSGSRCHGREQQVVPAATS